MTEPFLIELIFYFDINKHSINKKTIEREMFEIMNFTNLNTRRTCDPCDPRYSLN